jgi:hypothetical protein
MKGIRFYQEFEDRSKRRPCGTIVAACVCNGPYFSSSKACYDGFVGVFDRPNSPVNVSGVALDYLREKCKRVSEAIARTIHPALFERLDRD